MRSKRRLHKDVLLIRDGKVTEIAGVYDVPTVEGEPASRAVINKHKGLWMEIELVDEQPPKKPAK